MDHVIYILAVANTTRNRTNPKYKDHIHKYIGETLVDLNSSEPTIAAWRPTDQVHEATVYSDKMIVDRDIMAADQHFDVKLLTYVLKGSV